MSKYITGFCGVGLHEGTRPKSPSGKPMKVCVALGTCQCSCHEKINKMYSIAGEERVAQQNPDYEPAHSPDLTWLSSPGGGGPTTSATGAGGGGSLEVPSSDAAGLWEGRRTFAHTPTGVRARGKLEEEVRLVCNKFSAGELDGQATTKLIGLEIDGQSPPSPGAIRAVFMRWEKMGFAVIKDKPLRFVSYTPVGMERGLEALKAEWKRKHKGKQ